MDGPITIVYGSKWKYEGYFAKQQTLKGPRLIQFEQGVVCKWLTLMHSEGKPVTEPMVIERAKSF